jgi:hypothetical protein
MTDNTANGGALLHGVRVPKLEYRFYFALIFLVALPFAILFWAAIALRRGRLPEKGPIARAISEARAITPFLFQG